MHDQAPRFGSAFALGHARDYRCLSADGLAVLESILRIGKFSRHVKAVKPNLKPHVPRGTVITNGPSLLGIVGVVCFRLPENEQIAIAIHCGSRWCWPLTPPPPLRSNYLAVRRILGILRVRMRLVCFTALYLCLLMYVSVSWHSVDREPNVVVLVHDELRRSQVIVGSCVVGCAVNFMPIAHAMQMPIR